ncbi:MAG: stage III sporulation protein AA [Firmicutes bacterium]|nr:stage III sporulation protein AA [Bacillota bacterium]
MKIFDYLSPRLQKALQKLSGEELDVLEEIRLRIGQPLCLRKYNALFFLTLQGELSTQRENALIVMKDDLEKTLMMLSQSSFYALDEELRRGYITLPGGHRAGLCGHAVLENGHIRSQRDICSVNLRIAKQKKGCADSLMRHLIQKSGLPLHSLIISPPGCGKTTVLRDIAFSLSETYALQVGIIDERSELAAMSHGGAQLSVGTTCDVIDACPKAEGIMLMLRSMSPQVIICDEIGRREDMEAIFEAVNTGVKVIATAHAGSRSEALSRPVLGEMLKQNCFERLVLYSARQGPGTLEQIWNAKGETLYKAI